MAVPVGGEENTKGWELDEALAMVVESVGTSWVALRAVELEWSVVEWLVMGRGY